MRLKLRRIFYFVKRGYAMSNIKEKPKEKTKEKKAKEKQVKAKTSQKENHGSQSKPALSPQQAAKLMRDKYLRQLDQRQEESQNETGYAIDQVEDGGRFAVDELASLALPDRSRYQGQRIKEAPKPEPPQEDQPPALPEQGPQPLQDEAAGPRERLATSPREREQPIKTRQRTERPAPQSPQTHAGLTAAQRAKTAVENKDQKALQTSTTQTTDQYHKTTIEAIEQKTPQTTAAQTSAQRNKIAAESKTRKVPIIKEAGSIPGVPMIKERGISSADLSIESIYPTDQSMRKQASQQTPQAAPTPQINERRGIRRAGGPVVSPERPAASPGGPAKAAQAAKQRTVKARQSGLPSHRPRSSVDPPIESAKPGPFTERRFPKPKISTGGAAPKTRRAIYPKGGFSLKSFRPSIGRSSQAVRQTAQQLMKRQAMQKAVKAAKTSAAFFKKVIQATVKVATTLASGLIALAGGGVLLIALVVVIIIAAVVSSPFGLFFAGEDAAQGTVSVSEAVGTVNVAYNARLEEIQTESYDTIDITGTTPDWTDVLAVFAVKTAGVDVGGMDVATLDTDRVNKLTAVFWDMTSITFTEETIDHPASGETAAWTEKVLHITITAKTAEDMKTAYSFTPYQISALDELLADRAALSSLAGSLSVTNADALAVLNALPDDLSPERRAVVETALTLYGKVNYFWGGKSLVIGWDSRWGQLMKVWADGSPTTGTYRPYGLDCSGFADWVFYNASGGTYIIGHGGGAHMQHTYCSPITWSEAQPGDLVFYPEDTHVGIVCGHDESGNIQIIHCASGANNVVITGKAGFTSIARPLYYGE